MAQLFTVGHEFFKSLEDELFKKAGGFCLVFYILLKKLEVFVWFFIFYSSDIMFNLV